MVFPTKYDGWGIMTVKKFYREILEVMLPYARYEIAVKDWIKKINSFGVVITKIWI
uniref:PaREP2b n=1 Tax=Heterorhabditis bacteriophora TaxID=37862 RepID=A0A1I7X7T9_HETBA